MDVAGRSLLSTPQPIAFLSAVSSVQSAHLVAFQFKQVKMAQMLNVRSGCMWLKQ